MYKLIRFQELNLLRFLHVKQFHYSHSSRNSPRIYELNRRLNELWKSGQLDEARSLFDKMSERDEFTWNTMVAAYAHSGRLTEAKQVFDETPKKCSITWSSLISGFCRRGRETEGFQLFWQMLHEGHELSQFALGSVLRACSSKAMLCRGEQIHALVIKTRFDSNAFVNTGVVEMYAKCDSIVEAEMIFDEMPEKKSHVLWTAMITGYSHNNDGIGAIRCFRDMHAEGVQPNQYTFPSLLTACAAISARGFGGQIHACIIRLGFEANAYVGSALVDMYAKCGDLYSARIALESVEGDDVVSWNSMVVGCVRQGLEEEALLLFKKMHTKDMDVDDFTYPSVLNSCASMKDMESAKSVHCLIVKTGFEAYRLVSNALVDMYAKGGELGSAFEVFNGMTYRDIVSWTSLITGYAYNGSYEEALRLFCQLRSAGVDPDQIVIASVLSACAELTVLEFGQQVHGNFLKFGFRSTVSVDNSLVSMYAKCGCIEDAKKVFNSMKIRDVITWTALIIGYAQNGNGKYSLAIYDDMIASGEKPDFVTFIGLLFACSHAGFVEQGWRYFESMELVYGIKAGPDHYACMIDLLGRSGKMNEAKELLNQMSVEPDSTVWKALLSACRVHKDIELAERAANALFELEPQNAMPYVMLSNIYSAAGYYENTAKIRRLMKLRGISKEPGCSWIEINSKVHKFMSEDRSHPKTGQIYSKIDEIMMLIKEAGYVPNINFALHDVDEEGKELGLVYHSEKLAVAFGLLFLPQGAPIRIFKNLRVCGDCHAAMKFISRVFRRHIILRDSNCFHHFREGACSCGDYW